MKKYSFLLLLMLCLCGKVWGTSVTQTTTLNPIATSNGVSTWSADAQGVAFIMTGNDNNGWNYDSNNGKVTHNWIKMSKNATLSWNGNVSTITITKIIITGCASNAGLNNKVKVVAVGAGKDKTFNVSTSSSTYEVKDIFSSSCTSVRFEYDVSLLSSYFRITKIEIEYEGTLPVYYFSANIEGSEGATPRISLVNNNYTGTSVTTSAEGAKLSSTSASTTVYVSTPSSYRYNDYNYNFEGWYAGEQSSDQLSDVATTALTITSQSLSEETPTESVLYARYTQKQVPQFDFSLKVGIVGQPKYTNVFSTSNTAIALSSVTNSDATVATVEADLANRTINVTALKKGRATITITQAGDDDWVAKTQSYTIMVVNQGEWIWQQDAMVSGNSYYLYSITSGFLKDDDAFSESPSTLWTIEGTAYLAYTLTSANSKKVAIYNDNWTSNIHSNTTDKSGDDIVMSSALEDGYYSLYRAKELTNWFSNNDRNVYTTGTALAMQSDASYEWVFVSPAQKAASESYASASDYVGRYTTLFPALESQLSTVLGSNNYTSDDWVTCKANLDAIIAKCQAFDEDYAKFNETTHQVSLNATGDGFATFYSACPVSMPEGVMAFAGSYSNGTLTLTDIERDGKIPACTPVVLYNGGTNPTIILTYDNGDYSAVEGNKLHGSSYVITSLSNSQVTIDDVTGTAYALGYRDVDGDGTSEAGFFKYSTSATQISANKAFLVLEDGTSLAAVRMVRGEETATWLPIENDEPAKLDESLPMYNVMGQRVNASYKGIILQQGKKFYNY